MNLPGLKLKPPLALKSKFPTPKALTKISAQAFWDEFDKIAIGMRASHAPGSRWLRSFRTLGANPKKLRITQMRTLR